MKRPGGKTTKLQDKQIAFLRKLGFLVEVLDSEDDVNKFLDKLQGGDKK